MPITRRTSAKVGPWGIFRDGKLIDSSVNKSALQNRAAAMRRLDKKYGKHHSIRIRPLSGRDR